MGELSADAWDEFKAESALQSLNNPCWIGVNSKARVCRKRENHVVASPDVFVTLKCEIPR